MNKKNILICIAALVVLAIILLALKPGNTDPDRLADPTNGAVNSTAADASGENSEATVETMENGLPVPPGPYDNKPEPTEEKTTTATTAPVETQGEQEGEQNQQTEQPESSDVQTNVQPEGGETLPPDVTVSMGVVEGEGSADLDEDIVEEPTGNTQATEPATQPTTPPQSDLNDPTNPLSDNYDITTLTFEGYLAMTGEQQAAVVKAFASPDVFVQWYKASEAKYKAEHPDVEIGNDGIIDGGNLG